MKDLVRRLLLQLSPITLFKLQHYKLHKQFGCHAYWPNLASPRTFNEHVLRSKLDDSFCAIGKKVVDKLEVKKYVSDRIGQDKVIPTLAVFGDLESLIFSDFSESHVIKPTHLSGQVIFKSRGQARLTTGEMAQISGWLRRNHYYSTGEPQYRDLKPRIIVEPFIGTDSGPPNDYKIFCWQGEPRLIQVDTSRFQDHKRDFYDPKWQPLELQVRYPRGNELLEKPAPFAEMLDVARKLSSDYRFVRVDLYAVGGQILFGELTFHPGSGNEPFNCFESDLALGKYFGSAH